MAEKKNCTKKTCLEVSGAGRIVVTFLSSALHSLHCSMADLVAEAERLYMLCRQHLVSDPLKRAFVHMHPEHAAQHSLFEREYLRFIVLKLLTRDTGPTPRYSPCTAVDELWHIHVLVSISLPYNRLQKLRRTSLHADCTVLMPIHLSRV
jgi:hypothetical protein